MLNFDFLEKSLGMVSLTYFVNEFSRKTFLMLYSDQISFSDCLYFLRYCIICTLQLFVSQTVTPELLTPELHLSNQAALLHD